MRIGIISLGLIGSSLLKALIEKGNEIYCVTRNLDAIEKARQLGANSSNDINTLSECEIVFVCSPISTTVEMLDKLENVVNKNCIVLDVASVKEFVMKKERPYKFIGSHPMAGTENSGFDSGFKELFENAKWVLCPTKNSTEEDIQKAVSIINQTGATTIIADAKEHDMSVALISHAPMLISQAIFTTIENNNLAKKLASSGFRDMTRLAMSNTKMASDMLNYNNENITKSIDILNQKLNDLNNDYLSKIEKIANDRKAMYSQDGKNIYN